MYKPCKQHSTIYISNSLQYDKSNTMNKTQNCSFQKVYLFPNIAKYNSTMLKSAICCKKLIDNRAMAVNDEIFFTIFEK